jgi:ARG/rhodanese/phosphatase superfamily protein
MDAMIVEHLSSIELGEAQQHANMTVVPLLTAPRRGPRYMMLAQALADNLLTVSEVDEGGSVPQLKVTNRAAISVLLLDGEELSGAKQNRVLNTSVLLKKQSGTLIPVSCTEVGRWSYTSSDFENSGTVMAPRARMRKNRSVSASLNTRKTFASDQGEVWDSVAELGREAQIDSPTGAMRDVFAARQGDLNSYMEAFAAVDDQKGILVFINGRIVAFDILSRRSAYGLIHPKLVKSYALDALLQSQGKPSKARIEDAKSFLIEAQQCEETRHKSVGHGWDHRCRGPRLVGSALSYRKSVVHMAFFRAEQDEQTGRIASLQRRRRFRTTGGI